MLRLHEEFVEIAPYTAEIAPLVLRLDGDYFWDITLSSCKV